MTDPQQCTWLGTFNLWSECLNRCVYWIYVALIAHFAYKAFEAHMRKVMEEDRKNFF